PSSPHYDARSLQDALPISIAACKTSVSEYTSAHTTLPADNTAAGCSTTASQYVSSTGAGFDGTKISYTSNNTGASGGECTLRLSLTTTHVQITTTIRTCTP